MISNDNHSLLTVIGLPCHHAISLVQADNMQSGIDSVVMLTISVVSMPLVKRKLLYVSKNKKKKVHRDVWARILIDGHHQYQQIN